MINLIRKYTADNEPLFQLLVHHSRQVADRAVRIVDAHPEWQLDRRFVYEAAMLHDIGCVRVNAPGIHCLGADPYICHGLRGGEILRSEGLPQHARVAERHTGTGLTKSQIEARQLPLPPMDFLPETLEEQIICYADKFYSKSHPEAEKTYEQALHSLAKFGEEGLRIFSSWHDRFEG